MIKKPDIKSIGLDIANLYEIIGRSTPLPVDCGGLCGGLCCQEWEQGVGVYLLPGEEAFYTGREDWCRVEKQPGEGPFPGCPTYMLHCRGKCPRSCRPLLCRTFPLAPMINSQGEISIVLDGDGWLICPLVKLGDMQQISKTFAQKVLEVWQELVKHPIMLRYAEEYSARACGESQDKWRKLIK